MAEYLIQDTILTELANAVRTKTGNIDMITPGEMVSDLNAIPERVESDLIANGAIVTVPAGNYKSQATKSVELSTIATPSISVDSDGKITATVNQTAGYVPDGTTTATEQLATQAAKTIIPSRSPQIAVSSGIYTTGDITVAAIPSNYVELNYEVVGGTTQPSNPKENTIWVNTSTAITQYIFSPKSPISGAIISNAETFLGTLNGRNYTKKYNGKAAWAMVYNGIYTGPMLVSPVPENVYYYTSGNYTANIGPAGSVVYNGVTYYYTGGAWFSGDLTDGFPTILKGSSNEELALILAKTYEVGEGTVWFVTSTDTERPVSFNALKENGIMIYPTLAKQYISGSFTNVEVKARINGEWVEWQLSNLVLYNSGNEYTDITGGWKGVALSHSLGGSYNVSGNAPTVTKNTSGITIKQNTVKRGGALRPSNLIDITSYSTLKVTVGSYNVGSGCGLILQVRNQSGTVVGESNVTGTGTKTLSINSLSGPHYIDIYLFWYSSGDSAPSATITNVTLTNGG